MADVTVDSVTKVYDDAQGMEIAVEEIDLAINDSEFIVIVGPSGCGKSTLLRMIAGLESITDGKISIGDRVVNDLSPRERDIAMVFQNYALYPHKNVRDNMAYGLELSTDMSNDEIQQKVEETAEMLDITDHLDKKPSALSGGQQQRVATGRAIVREPSVFLFDEPLSNLDAKLRVHMRTELLRLHTTLQITSIYVTHDQEEAMTMADQIVVMNDGKIQQIGTPKEVYYEPANQFVADFIGSPSINFFDVTLERVDGEPVLVNDGFEYAISDDLFSHIQEETRSESFILGIRPEGIRLANEGETDNAIRCAVEVVETVGSDNFVYLNVNGQETRMRTGAAVNPVEGATVNIHFDESQIYLFDGETKEIVYAPAFAGIDTEVPSIKSS
jgi:multiple sugar transport system ATP-binding protein